MHMPCSITSLDGEHQAVIDKAFADAKTHIGEVDREKAALRERFERHAEEFLERLNVGECEADSVFAEALGLLFIPCKTASEAALRFGLVRSKAMRVVERFAEENVG